MRVLLFACLCFILVFNSCVFDTHAKKIFDHYYLVRVSAEGTSLNYKLPNGDFIERIPTEVTGYFVLKDELLLVRQLKEKNENYYIVSMKKDDGYVDSQSILEGPYDYINFISLCKQRFTINTVTFQK